MNNTAHKAALVGVLLIGGAVGAAGAGCEKRKAAASPAPASPPPAADNSGINKRDASPGAVTPTDQGESEADRKITAEIRKAVVGDSVMSVNAHNCKIVTRSGVVTLRGPVNSQAEKDSVERIAKGVAGVTSVVNQLEIKQ